MILVTGISGRVGGALARHLLQLGQQVGGLVRDPKQLNALPSGVVGFVGDFDDPSSTKTAMKNADSLYLLCGMARIEGLYDVAKKSGVRHVVQLSGAAVLAREGSNAISRFMIEAERAAEQSGIDYTFLRPLSFMSNALRWAGQVRSGNQVRLPFESVPEALIDPYDIGRVAATILSSPEEHVGKAYRLSGPQALRPSDCVKTIAEVLNRKIEFIALSNDEARKQMSEAMPQEIVEAFLDLYTGTAPEETAADENVERITGTPPRTFAIWAQENRASFGGG